jgi:hypothetical protein
MKIASPHWDDALGVCVKHGVPSLPCPACLVGEGDSDLEFVVSELDLNVLEVDHALGHATSLRDLVPTNVTNPTFVRGF